MIRMVIVISYGFIIVIILAIDNIDIIIIKVAVLLSWLGLLSCYYHYNYFVHIFPFFEKTNLLKAIEDSRSRLLKRMTAVA